MIFNHLEYSGAIFLEEECMEEHGTLWLYETHQMAATNTYLQKEILSTARRGKPTLTLPPISNV